MSNNLFQVLNMSDDEDTQQQQKAQQQVNKKNKQKRDQEQVIPVEQVQKESTQHHNPVPKQKGLTSEPHPKDRQSGTGRGKELRKEGGGRRNWGNYKDDLKSEKYDPATKPEESTTTEQPTQQEAEQQPEVPLPPPEKTLADYYQARGVDVETILKQQEQKPQLKKIDEEALKKEKLFVMKTKVDEKREQEQKAQKKPTTQKQEYRSELNTQASEYLGFTAERGERRVNDHRDDRKGNDHRDDRKGDDRRHHHKGGDRHAEQGNKKPVQQGVQIDDKDFPAL